MMTTTTTSRSRDTTRRTLGHRGALWTAAAVAALSLWASAAPTVTYPLYASSWHLTPTATTAIFAVYPVVLVVFLLVFGQVSDHIGRRVTMLVGVSAMALGALLFALAPSVGWVYLGRALSGAGVALALTPATAAVHELHAEDKKSRASAVTTAATAVGLALATVVGGALTEYAPAPLHLSFWVLVAVTGAVLPLIWMMPRDERPEGLGPWRPRPVRIGRDLRRAYVASALAVTAAYAFGSVFLALGADVARSLVGTTNIFVVGLVLSAMSATVGLSALGVRRVPAGRQVVTGTLATLVALALLEVSATAHSLPVFLVATTLSGFSYGLMFSGGLGLIAAHAPAHARAGAVAAVYLVAYVLQGATALSLGLVATSSGLGTALLIGVVAIGLLAVLSLGTAHALGRVPGATVATEVS